MIGVTQDYVAEKVGVRFQQIQKYECGGNRISAGRLWKIAQALEVPVSYFFEGLEDNQFSETSADENPPYKVSHEEMSCMAALYKELDPHARKNFLELMKSCAKKEIASD